MASTTTASRRLLSLIGRLGVRYKSWLNAALCVAVFFITIAAVRYLWITFEDVSLKEIQEAIAAISFTRVALAGGLILLAYFIMTGYDTFGLRQAGSSLAYPKIALVSFIGDTFNANMGFSAAVGSAVKLRLFIKRGEKASVVARAIAIYTIAYWAALSFLVAACGIFFFLSKNASSAPPYSSLYLVSIVIACVVSAAYLFACINSRAFSGNKFLAAVLPRGATGLKLLLVGIAEWFCTVLAFFILIPGAGATDFPAFATVFLFAHTLSIVSQSPGGIGVFESGVLLMNPGFSNTSLLGTFIIFRMLFYILPFAAAFMLFVLFEVRNFYTKSISSRMRKIVAPAALVASPPLPFVSIIVPAHNEDRSLPACLDALHAQEYAGAYEIIVVDNASSDATAAVTLAKGARVVREPVKGYNRAVKRGFDEAAGEIIACTDADTIVGQDWILKIVETLSSEGVVACGGVFRFYDGPLWIRLLGMVFGRCNYHIAGANMGVWKNAYRRAGGFSLTVNLGADVDIHLRLKRIGKVIIDRSLVAATSSRRFTGAFWATVVRYYLNDFWLFTFKKPIFHSFRDFRMSMPRDSYRRRWAVPAAAAALIVVCSIWMLELPFNQMFGSVFAKGSRVRAVALTFDDGPGASTAEILDILKSYGAKATFFVIGRNAKENPAAVKRIGREGHEIGNHTHTHPLRAAIDLPRALKKELDSAETVIQALSGGRSTLFRPPHGWRNPWMIRECTANGYDVVLWSIDSKDWRVKNQHQIANHVFRHTRQGSIILFHDRLNTGKDKGMAHTVKVLPVILDSLSRAGFSFVTVSELKALSRESGYFAEARFPLEARIKTAIGRMYYHFSPPVDEPRKRYRAAP